jgi:hypothetical protein
MRIVTPAPDPYKTQNDSACAETPTEPDDGPTGLGLTRNDDQMISRFRLDVDSRLGLGTAG